MKTKMTRTMTLILMRTKSSCHDTLKGSEWRKTPPSSTSQIRLKKIQQGIIHLNPAVFETEPPQIETKVEQKEYHGMDAKDRTLHIIGVIMVEQYSINNPC
jgi:hypothetical protein